MKTLFSFLTLVLLAGSATAGTTKISQVALLNISSGGNVKPNLMLLYDNSGSMRSAFTPDYLNDTTTCRSRALMSGGTTRCAVGHPPFNSADFNKQYYNPKVRYAPPVRADGTVYPSLTSANTTEWTAVTTDGFGVNRTNLAGSSSTSTNLVTGFPDLDWCNGSSDCKYNAVTYRYPDNTYTSASVRSGNPYYYTIKVAEYCTDASLTTCQTTAVDAPAPAGYPIPAKVRWCDTTALTNCQAKYVGAFKYPRFSNTSNGVVSHYGTITIGASDDANSLEITKVIVSPPSPSAPFEITNGVVAAASGTNSATKREIVATALAASILAKTGLAYQYTACVLKPNPASSPVKACEEFNITLGSSNMVAVLPIDCTATATNKDIGPCTEVRDSSRAGWGMTVVAPTVALEAAQAATALIKVSGQAGDTKAPKLASITLSNTALLDSAGLTFATGDTAATIATKIRSAIGTRGTITAYLGGTTGLSTVCSAASNTSVCLVNTATNAGDKQVTMGKLTDKNTIDFQTVKSTSATEARSDRIPTSVAPPGAGASVFVRADIVPARDSYPKEGNRTDCAASSHCTYNEEMTNFANWYGYYKTRNQMMKSSVGLAFQRINDNFKVGLVSLSDAAAGNAMMKPKIFSGTHRGAWYDALYAMDGSSVTPIRAALHSIGKMYANQDPYEAPVGEEVITTPCQQNFTFITTDGYWNGAAAANVTNNDNVENLNRFCSRGSGCVDPAAQTGNSLADVALYWYNGGSNTTTTSLRPSLEDMSKVGLVPATAGQNTHLHMVTYALGLGVDGIMNYEPRYDTSPVEGGDFHKLITGVTSGCPWNNNGAYVWPDPQTGVSGSEAYQSRVDDLWHAAINGHGKYFSASDPLQVVDGLSKALSSIEVKIGAAAAAATSTPNISQHDNDIFSATFTTVHWYGELSDRKIDLVSGEVSPTAVWNTSHSLGLKVGAATDSRKIWMLDTAAGALKEFKYSELSATEKAWFDLKCSALSQCPSLSVENKAVLDSGTNIVDWLRGQQQYANGTVMRAYGRTPPAPAGPAVPLPIVLGDIASSKPAYLREPRKAYTLEGYSDYKTAKATREPAVFVAANDGMLHAFDAGTGDEMWAYAPRMTMKKLHLQASTTYDRNHQFSADGSPEVADVKIGANWKTVLVAGMNGGGRGYYALDVTDPAHPLALWELCADSAVCTGTKHQPDIGLSFGAPQFGTWKASDNTVHWVVFLSSGYNNVPGTDGVQEGNGIGYLYVVDVGTGAVLAKLSTGSGSVDTPSGLARITAVSANPNTDPLVTQVYGGDILGQMWRFDFTAPGAATIVKMGTSVVSTAAGNVAQPITSRPDVTLCQVGNTVQKVVAFGTGRLLDVTDVDNSELQSIYVLKDSATGITATEWRNDANMARQTLARSGNTAYTISGAQVDLSTQLGWYVDLNLNAGERVNLDPAIVSGGLNVVTNLPKSSSACSVGGSSNVYQLNVCTGTAIGTTAGGTGANGAAAIAGDMLSNSSAAVGFIIIRLPSGALKMITTTADGKTITTGVAPASSQGARRTGWRRFRN